MKRIIAYLKPYRKLLLFSALLISVSTLCDLWLPKLMSELLDSGVKEKDFPFILRNCIKMLAVATASLLTIIYGTKLSSRVVASFSADVRADVFRKVNTLTFEEFGKLGTAALVTRATHDVETLSWVAAMLGGTIITIPMLFIGGVVLAMRKDVVLSLIMLAFIPLIFIVVYFVGKRVLPLWEKSDEYIDKQNGIMRERLRGIRVIRAFNSEPLEHERISDATRVMAENIIKGNVSMGILTPLAMLVLNLSVVLIVYFGGWRMVHNVGALSAGDIFAITQYITLVMNGVIMASFAIVMFPHAQVAARRIGQVMEAKGMEDNSDGEAVELTGDIRFDNVSFSYGGAEAAVSNINLHIAKGQRVSVIGGTGSGKSTLISLLLGFRLPSEGQICFDGVPTGRLSKHRLRESISCVLQGSAIYSGTIEENIRMGNPNADDAAIRQAAQIAQLSDFIESVEGGMSYEIKQAGKNLSGGQKQRLSIARAIVRQAPIYIFDDSFSALDFLTEKNLRTALNESTQGKTQLVVTQRVTSAMNADCIFVMDKGQLVDSGKHDELLSRCKIYREIFASQTGGSTK